MLGLHLFTKEYREGIAQEHLRNDQIKLTFVLPYHHKTTPICFIKVNKPANNLLI